MREGIDFPQRRKGAEEAQRTQRVEEMFFSPETSSQLIDSSSEHCGIGLRPVHPSAARTALVGRPPACPSERSSDCFGGAGFSLPIRAQLGLYFLRASARALRARFPIPFHHDAFVA